MKISPLVCLLLTTAALLLAGCGTLPSPESGGAPDEIVGTAAVVIGADTTVADLQRSYGGEVTIFRPEAGFAVLGFTAAALADREGLEPIEIEDNLATFDSPVAALGSGSWSQGFSSWNGGFGSWSGGFSSWSGGFSDWSGGFPDWSGDEQDWTGDEPTHTPLDNLRLWEQINLPWAHQIADRLGEGVIVAVIDTGIDTAHPAFAGRLLPGYDFLDDDDDPSEEPGAAYGHGTGVAGIVLQVAPNATILPIRVLDGDGYGDTDDIALAIDWAVTRGADIINLSLGGHDTSAVVESVLKYASLQGVLVATSSGNSGDENVTFPASFAALDGWKTRLISVGSVGTDDVKSPFSTYGADGIDLMAPGEYVFSAVPDERVGYWTGTSFAAPMVSGALALALGQPELEQAVTSMGTHVTNSSMDQLDLVPGNEPFRGQLGRGRLDLRPFLEKVLALVD